ncbi:MAG: RNA polymerase sigma-70 factor [Bacteroidetes bacterium]|nr:RNA polymerase sigma-70 factor [Bacteroidota bacterium]
MLEEDLRHKLKNGDPAVFQFLFSRYYAALCIYATRFTGEKDAAEEVVHETFIKLWERHKSIEITDNIIGYLYRSVQNNSLNYLKRLQIKYRYSEAYSQKLKEAEDYFAVTQETGQSVLLAKELELKIREAIDELPEQCREIFKLSRFTGLKNQEIAEKSKLP